MQFTTLSTSAVYHRTDTDKNTYISLDSQEQLTVKKKNIHPLSYVAQQ